MHLKQARRPLGECESSRNEFTFMETNRRLRRLRRMARGVDSETYQERVPIRLLFITRTDRKQVLTEAEQANKRQEKAL